MIRVATAIELAADFTDFEFTACGDKRDGKQGEEVEDEGRG